jgi:hypothetical protein
VHRQLRTPLIRIRRLTRVRTSIPISFLCRKFSLSGRPEGVLRER